MTFIYILDAAADVVKTVLSIYFAWNMYKEVKAKKLIEVIFYGFLLVAALI